MEQLQRATRPPIKNGREWRPNGQGPHDDLEVRVAYSLRHGETLVGFLADLALTQFTLFRKEDGWLIMLKAERGKKKRVAFMNASTFSGALVLAATAMDSGNVPWKEDTPRPSG